MAGAGVALVKVVMRGIIGAAQSWSTGVYFAVSATESSYPSKAFLESIGSAVNAAVVAYWGGRLHTINTTGTQLLGWTTYGYAPDSNLSGSENSYEFETPSPGSSSGSLPVLTAMVQSLRTNSSGRSYRGRMYVPATGANLGGDGHFASLDCTDMASDTATYLMALSTAIQGGTPATAATPVVASFTKGFSTTITSVLVDNIPDTQHRREDKLGASFTGVAEVTA